MIPPPDRPIARKRAARGLVAVEGQHPKSGENDIGEGFSGL
jgi:hypothetical protein